VGLVELGDQPAVRRESAKTVGRGAQRNGAREVRLRTWLYPANISSDVINITRSGGSLHKNAYGEEVTDAHGYRSDAAGYPQPQKACDQNVMDAPCESGQLLHILALRAARLPYPCAGSCDMNQPMLGS